MSGRGGAYVVFGWALLNAALAGMLLGFRHNWVQVAGSFAAVATVVAVAVLAAASSGEAGRRYLPEASGGAPIVAAGLVLVTLGAGLGLWVALVGAVVLGAGVVLLARERTR